MSRTGDAVKLCKPLMEGSVVEQIDCSPIPEQMVFRVRAPNGRQSWVVLNGAFDLGINATEINANHRLLAQVEHAKWAEAERARATRLAERRAAVSMPAKSADDCPPHGIVRPSVEVVR